MDLESIRQEEWILNNKIMVVPKIQPLITNQKFRLKLLTDQTAKQQSSKKLNPEMSTNPKEEEKQHRKMQDIFINQINHLKIASVQKSKEKK